MSKEMKPEVKSAIISGIFAVVVACITGFFLLLNDWTKEGIIGFGFSATPTPSHSTDVSSEGEVSGSPESEKAASAPMATSTARPTLKPTSDVSGVVLSKCQWIEANFPQSQEAIAAEFGLPVNRVKVFREGCGDIIDGFLIRGGTDTEYTTEVEMEVPEGGCIDASSNAEFTGHHEQKPWGIRAYGGVVRAMVMTYWPWCDELH